MYTNGLIVTFALPPIRIAGLRIRLSFLWPLLMLGLIWRFGLTTGLTATGIALFSVLIHDLCHLMIARSAGGDMDELLLWPAGGLSEPFGRGHLSDHVHTMLAGPAANLLLAASSFSVLNASELLPLLNLDAALLSQDFAVRFWQMAFLINCGLFLINLLPITPFDGGVLARTYLTTRFTEAESQDLMIRFGLVVAIFGVICGFVFDSSGLTALSTFVLVLQMNENVRWQETYFTHPEEFQYESDAPDESLAGFFEEPLPFDPVTEDEELDEFQNEWREYETDQEDLRQQQEQSDNDLLDSLLEKIHLDGPSALSDDEHHLLEQVSRRLRQRNLES